VTQKELSIVVTTPELEAAIRADMEWKKQVSALLLRLTQEVGAHDRLFIADLDVTRIIEVAELV